MTSTSPQPIIPYPVVARRRPSRHEPRSDKPGGYKDFLLQRGRATNLAVLLLCGVTVVSLLVNVRLYLGDAVFRRNDHVDPVPISIASTLQNPHSNLRHLVIVAGHAIFIGCDATRATMDSSWILEAYQHDGTVSTLIKHVTKGAALAVQDPLALLVFSGGQTRRDSDYTEAASYARLAKSGNIYEQFMSHERRVGVEFDRVTTEDFALDSLENLLFSIARFREFTDHYPTYITLVGFEMKRRRFEEIHRAALRWPLTAFKYVGIDNEHMSDEAYEGERTQGLEPWARDSYGCKGNLLGKKRKRNPYRRYHPYHTSAPELEALLEYCPADNQIFEGRLPWD